MAVSADAGPAVKIRFVIRFVRCKMVDRQSARNSYTRIPGFHLGEGPQGRERKEALLRLASRYLWRGRPSIGRFIVALADAEIRRYRREGGMPR